MIRSGSIRRAIALAVGIAAIGPMRLALAQNPAPTTLVYAVYDNEKAAKEAFSAMRDAQRKGVIHVESFAVVSKDQNGRVHVKSTQRRSARAGAIIGALVGVLGGPAGVAVGAAAGGGIGYLTGRAVGIPRSQIDEIKSSLTPGSSAVIAVVQQRWAADLESSLRAAHAKQVLDSKIANPEGGGEPSGTEENAAPPADDDAEKPSNP